MRKSHWQNKPDAHLTKIPTTIAHKKATIMSKDVWGAVSKVRMVQLVREILYVSIEVSA